MAWRSSGDSNAALINNLADNGLITSDRVREAMLGVDRAHYAPRAPYQDSPQSIGHRATISAPHMHAAAAESLLPLIRNDSHASASSSGQLPSSASIRILDIGSGSGYLTHVLANLGGPSSLVVGVDHIQALVDLATTNMSKSEVGRELLSDKGRDPRVRFVCADGRKGWPADGPYDAIHVGAAAAEAHDKLIAQLKSPGRLFIPVDDGEGAQYIWVIDKDDEGAVTGKRQFGVRYVPLTDAPK